MPFLETNRGEEPMDVDAVQGDSKSIRKRRRNAENKKTVCDGKIDAIEQLAEEVRRMHTESVAVDALRDEIAAAFPIRDSQPGIPTRGKQYPNKVNKVLVGRQEIKCWQCGKFGHVRRECRSGPQNYQSVNMQGRDFRQGQGQHNSQNQKQNAQRSFWGQGQGKNNFRPSGPQGQQTQNAPKRKN
jgi:hypothetical protein